MSSKFYKNAQNEVFAFEADGSQDDYIPENLTPISENEADDLRKPQLTVSQVWERIKVERERRKTGGVKVGAKWYHSDDGSRIQQMALVMMGANLPAVQWKTMDGSFIAMTPTLAQQIFAAQAASDQAVFAVAEAHRVAMEASQDPSTYDYSTGWPDTFADTL